MLKSRVAVTALILASAGLALAACHSSTTTGLTTPGDAAQGDDIDLSSSYNLAFFAGGPVIDHADGATLEMTQSSYNVHGFGNYGGIGPDSGAYVALDTSSVTGIDAGSLIFTSAIPGVGQTVATFVLSHDSLIVNVIQLGGSIQNTVWLK
jgi:hypothetical protein